MRPTDPRLRAPARPAAAPLAGVLAGGVVASLLTIAQACAVAGLVVAVVRRTPSPALAAGGGGGLRRPGRDRLAGRRCAPRARPASVGTDVRRRLVLAALDAPTGRTRPTGEFALLATRGVAAVEPYLTRYLPALVLAGVLPLLTVLAIATQDLPSAVIVLATLPLVPVFGALVGLATRDRAETQWRALAPCPATSST